MERVLLVGVIGKAIFFVTDNMNEAKHFVETSPTNKNSNWFIDLAEVGKIDGVRTVATWENGTWFGEMAGVIGRIQGQ